MITELLISTLMIAVVATVVGAIHFVLAVREERKSKSVKPDLSESNRAPFGSFAIGIESCGQIRPRFTSAELRNSSHVAISAPQRYDVFAMSR